MPPWVRARAWSAMAQAMGYGTSNLGASPALGMILEQPVGGVLIGTRVNPTSTLKGSHMSNKAVFCIANSQAQTDLIVDRLKGESFNNSDISVLFPDRNATRDFAHEKNTKAPEGAATGAGAGGLMGGALGWLVGIGALAIPGAGPFIAAGPILAALSGAALGGALGGIAGALIGMGIPELEAKLYENKIRGGNILISVHTESSEQLAKAKEIFEDLQATDITSTTETAAPKGEKTRA